MSAPERIWIDSFRIENGYTIVAGANVPHVDGGTPYLRADIAASQLAKKEVEQQAKDKEYWSTLEQCANLETELAEARADGKASYKMAYDAGVQWKLRAEAAEAERDRLAAACDTTRMERDEARGLLKRAQQTVPDAYVNWHQAVRTALANVKGG